jgi:hypothetical protein
MYHFYVQMECPMTDGLLESLEVNLDFSSRSSIISASATLSWFFSIYLNLEVIPGDEHLLLTDATEELPEEWLVDCSQDSVPGCPPAEMYAFVPVVHLVPDLIAFQLTAIC